MWIKWVCLSHEALQALKQLVKAADAAEVDSPRLTPVAIHCRRVRG